MKLVAVILAGGLGSKLWPKSTESKPKQFTHSIGDGTMLQNTFTRISTIFPTDNIYIITNEEYTDIVKEQLPALSDDHVIAEPFGRNTAPALALVQTILSRKYDENTVLCSFPSDHIISNLGEFKESLHNAAEFAFEKEAIVTLGINPTRPDTQYGYVQIDEDPADLGKYYEKGIRYSRNFAEKPDPGTAERFLESGDFLWNSGIFFWKFRTFYEKFDKHLPDHSKNFKELSTYLDSKDFYKELIYTYKKIDSISVDYGILERVDNVYVVKSSFEWTDLETWDELYRISMKDGRGNVIEGEVININTKDSFISTNEKLIGVVDLEDIIVIDTDHGILICKRGSSDKVQEIIDYMRRKNINKYL